MHSISFTLIQSSLYWEDKQANLDMFAEKIRGLQQPTHVIILPEMFSTGFSMKPEILSEDMNGQTVEWMKRIAQEKKAIITGSIIIKEDEKFYNRLIWMLPNGKNGFYDKRHLFAFAEEDKHYTSGTKRFIASVNGWKINLMVCYDLRFPVWARQSPPLHEERGLGGEALEYDALIYVANWPQKRSIAWNTLLRARAIENQCYVIGVNRVGEDGNGIHYTGGSTVIDPLGEILYYKEAEEDIFTISLDKEHLQTLRNKFPFLKDADEFEIIT